jgi:hypothetical protein
MFSVRKFGDAELIIIGVIMTFAGMSDLPATLHSVKRRPKPLPAPIGIHLQSLLSQRIPAPAAI